MNTSPRDVAIKAVSELLPQNTVTKTVTELAPILFQVAPVAINSIRIRYHRYGKKSEERMTAIKQAYQAHCREEKNSPFSTISPIQLKKSENPSDNNKQNEEYPEYFVMNDKEPLIPELFLKKFIPITDAARWTNRLRKQALSTTISNLIGYICQYQITCAKGVGEDSIPEITTNYLRALENRIKGDNHFYYDPFTMFCEEFKTWLVLLSYQELNDTTKKYVKMRIKYVRELYLKYKIFAQPKVLEAFLPILLHIKEFLEDEIQTNIDLALSQRSSRDAFNDLLLEIEATRRNLLQLIFYAFRDSREISEGFDVDQLRNPTLNSYQRALNNTSGKLLKYLLNNSVMNQQPSDFKFSYKFLSKNNDNPIYPFKTDTINLSNWFKMEDKEDKEDKEELGILKELLEQDVNDIEIIYVTEAQEYEKKLKNWLQSHQPKDVLFIISPNYVWTAYLLKNLQQECEIKTFEPNSIFDKALNKINTKNILAENKENLRTLLKEQMVFESTARNLTTHFLLLHGYVEKITVFYRICQKLFGLSGDIGNLILYGCAAKNVQGTLSDFDTLKEKIQISLKILKNTDDEFYKKFTSNLIAETDKKKQWADISYKKFIEAYEAFQENLKLCDSKRDEIICLIRRINHPNYSEQVRKNIDDLLILINFFNGNELPSIKMKEQKMSLPAKYFRSLLQDKAVLSQDDNEAFKEGCKLCDEAKREQKFNKDEKVWREKYKKAGELFQRVLSNNPLNFQPYLWGTLSSMAIQDYDKALALVEQGLEYYPEEENFNNYLQLIYYRAQIKESQRDILGAQDDLNQILEKAHEGSELYKIVAEKMKTFLKYSAQTIESPAKTFK